MTQVLDDLAWIGLLAAWYGVGLVLAAQTTLWGWQ